MHENQNIKKISMQLGPGIFIPCITDKGPYQRKLSSITGCDDISAFFGKGKWKAVPVT